MSDIFGSLVDGIFSTGNMLLGSALAANASGKAFGRQLYAMQEQARLNYDYGQRSLRESPTAQREGLVNAGYNPMLAVQQATGSANSSFASPNSAPVDESAGNITAVTQARNDVQRLRNETETTESTVQANNATSFKTRMEGLAQQIKNKYLDIREKIEIGKASAETTKLQSDTAYNNAVIENLKARLELDKYIADLQSFTGLQVGAMQASASRYATDVDAETKRGTITYKNPFGLGGGSKYYQPDDVIRKPRPGNFKYYDSNDRKYWHNYY